MLAAAGAFLLLGDRPDRAAWVGIGLVSAGCLVLAVGRSLSRLGLGLALASGLLTSLYTVVDAAGVRAAVSSWVFVTWFFVDDGVVMTALYAARHPGRWRAGLWADRRWDGVAGLVTLVAFGSALLAVALAPVDEVAALREAGVLFALALAHWGLREALTWRRAIGGAAIAAGAVAITL